MPTEQKVAGVKRKRTIPGNGEDIAAKLKNKLHHGITEVRRAAKKVKGQEIQKSVKRLKGVRTKDPDSSEASQLAAELIYLKALDTELFGTTALHSKLKKDKILSSDDDFLSTLSSELPEQLIVSAKTDSSEAKVDARLLSSKALASQVSAVVTSLRNIVNPAPKEWEQDVKDEDSDAPDPLVRKKAIKVPTVFGNASNSGSDISEEIDDQVSGARIVEEADELLDDGGWESGSIHDSDDTSVEDSPAERSIGDNEVHPPKKLKFEVRPPAKINTSHVMSQSGVGPGSSTFLPSLSVGFTRGDSDSEPEDIDDAPKKNRRGQRARRAIWEKKYGRNANHVKKGQEEAPASRQRTGTVSSDDRQRSQQEFARRPPKQAPQIPLNWHQPPGYKTVENNRDKPLHPSWEAKKKLKEKQNPSIVPAQGKKIVF